MDPLTIGATVGMAVVSKLTKTLIEKAIDPEVVARGVNWIFSAVDHFLKVRKKKKSKDVPISKPPCSMSPAEQPSEIDTSYVEGKTAAVEKIAKSLENQNQATVETGVLLEALDDFMIEQLSKEVISLMNQIETYLGNLLSEEEKAAQYGGLMFSPPIVKNTIRLQHEEISKRVVRLNVCMQKAYGTSASNLDSLVWAAKDKSW